MGMRVRTELARMCMHAVYNSSLPARSFLQVAELSEGGPNPKHESKACNPEQARQASTQAKLPMGCPNVANMLRHGVSVSYVFARAHL
jgi:hypothetical protein